MFETDLQETTYLANGWHTFRVIRYKIKFQHIKKVKNTFDRNYLCLQKIHYIQSAYFIGPRTVLSIYTTKEKPDG